MTPSLLQVQRLTRGFGGLPVVRDLSLDLRPGEIVGLVGANGAGKTTLIRLISGELRPDAGSVFLGGEDLTPLPTWARARRGVGRSFQYPPAVEGMTLRDAIRLPLERARQLGAVSTPDLWADAVIEGLGIVQALNTSMTCASPQDLKLADLARSLVPCPRVLLADEPLAALDPEQISRVLDMLCGVARQGTTVLMVEHRLEGLFAVSTRVLVMDQGQILAEGTPDEILKDPLVRERYLGGLCSVRAQHPSGSDTPPGVPG